MSIIGHTLATSEIAKGIWDWQTNKLQNAEIAVYEITADSQ